MNDRDSYTKARMDQLRFYAPSHFIPEADLQAHASTFVTDAIRSFGSSVHEQVIPVQVEAEGHLFLIQYLPWDSTFFDRPTYKIFTVLYGHQNRRLLTKAINQFKQLFFIEKDRYVFMEMPAEDILLMQAFNQAGFGVIETRLTYFKAVKNFTNQRFAVRKATIADVPAIRETASACRNPFDRFHAEPAFNTDLADRFLGKYAEEAVAGYCDEVLVPNEPGVPCKAFMALNHGLKRRDNSDTTLSKVVLSAVSGECRGWHYKLLSEALFEAKRKASHYVVMTTQATNRAVIRNSEKLGFQLGSISHILSYCAE